MHSVDDIGVRVRLPRFLNTLLGPKRRDVLVPARPVDKATFSYSAVGAASQLPQSPFVLLLRTFGLDGSTRVGNPRSGPNFEVNTLEAIIRGVSAE